MLKGKITGRIKELERFTKILKECPEIKELKAQKPTKNSHSVLYREYMSIELETSDPVEQKLKEGQEKEKE